MTAVISGHPHPSQQPAAPQTHPRWESLDVLRGLALCFMVVHHFHHWTAGNVRERFIGFPGMVITDLAAPAFAVGVGAAAFLVGRQIAGNESINWRRARRALRRWGEVLLLGVVIDLAVGGGIDGGGVLPTLAVLGTVTSVLAVLGLRQAWLWWGLAALCAVFAVPASAGDPIGFVEELWAGPFSIVVYGTFAAFGAGLAAAADGGGEERLPLVRGTLAVLAAGALGWLLAGDHVAPDGLWPPDRAPGGLAFTMWGLVGTLVLWMALRAITDRESVLSRGLARAGRRTLLVFGTHYVVKLVLQWTDNLGELDTPAWNAATWVAALGACLISMMPAVRLRRSTERSDAFATS